MQKNRAYKVLLEGTPVVDGGKASRIVWIAAETRQMVLRVIASMHARIVEEAEDYCQADFELPRDLAAIQTQLKSGDPLVVEARLKVAVHSGHGFQGLDDMQSWMTACLNTNENHASVAVELGNVADRSSGDLRTLAQMVLDTCKRAVEKRRSLDNINLDSLISEYQVCKQAQSLGLTTDLFYAKRTLEDEGYQVRSKGKYLEVSDPVQQSAPGGKLVMCEKHNLVKIRSDREARAFLADRT